ncbi:hypothetical protein [Erythrobacter sp. HL-111]|uniref:hypothetical protein n=1 Tax=Erythrobacter sp. HL-111 TaxID=1798193 RepID=UPI00087DC6C5|nr:hypothetical protein [Erythrobacter sp. HL-111]SDS66020.1 hypothetical protein SAMN04515621_1976 [Erythrobacter sp. HL-111]
MKLVLKAVLLVLAAILGLVLLLTDPAPLAGPRPAPDAEQVGAARDAVLQLRPLATARDETRQVNLDAQHLDGLSALATHGLRPDRLEAFISGSVLHVEASRQLPLGRWLNLAAETSGSAEGFPELHIAIGSLELSPFFSRLLAETFRSGLRLAGADIPPLDELVRKVAVGEDRVSLSIDWPGDAGLLGEVLQTRSGVDPALAVRIHCELAERQRADPQDDLAVQVRRAFPIGRAGSATPESNAAAFVALAMAIVDTKVGTLTGIDAAAIEACPMPASPIALHGREDLAKHWALSAALSVGSGTQVAEAMGEWKELADSLASRSEFQPGDPTGFSLVDIAADRSGFRTADAASDPASAKAMARRLSGARPEEILPPALLSFEEGPDVDFVGRYGSLDDPRFAKVLKKIDAVLEREGLLRP